MANQNLNIDELFLRGLAGYSEVPPAAVWNALEKRLDVGKSRPFGWWWMALVLIVTGISAYLGKGFLFPGSDMIHSNAQVTVNADAISTNAPNTPNTTTTNNSTIANTKANNDPITTDKNNNSNSSQTSQNTNIELNDQQKINNTSKTIPVTINNDNNNNTSTIINTPTIQRQKDEVNNLSTAVANVSTPTKKPQKENLITVPNTTTIFEDKGANTSTTTAANNHSSKNNTITTNTTTLKDTITTSQHQDIVTATKSVKENKKLFNTNETKTNAVVVNNNRQKTDKKEIVTTNTSATNYTKNTSVTQQKQPTDQDSSLNNKNSYKHVLSNATNSKQTTTPVINTNTAIANAGNKTSPPPIIPQTGNTTESNIGKTGTDIAEILQGIKDGKVNGTDANRVKYEMGVKAAYSFGTQAFSINSLILSLYFQLDVSKKWALQFTPGLKISSTGGGPFKLPETFISPYTTILDTNTHSAWNVSNYTHSFDSITKKHSLDNSRTTEIELPLLLKYKVGNNFYVFAGPVFTLGNIIAISTTTDSVHASPISGIDSVAAPGYVTASYIYSKHHSSPLYSTYDGAEYENPSATSMRIGLMVGVNYNPDNKLGIYLSLQPNFSDLNFIPNNAIRSLYSQTYIRVGVTYKLFGTKY